MRRWSVDANNRARLQHPELSGMTFAQSGTGGHSSVGENASFIGELVSPMPAAGLANVDYRGRCAVMIRSGVITGGSINAGGTIIGCDSCGIGNDVQSGLRRLLLHGGGNVNRDLLNIRWRIGDWS
jgi:hypothetical protein